MAIDNFIPQMWAAGVQEAFTSNASVINTLTTNFSGEAAKGNTVHIIGAVTPTIVDYKAAGRNITAEALNDTEVELLIDNEFAFSVNIDDVDAVQAAGTFDAWVTSAGKALVEKSEAAVLAELFVSGTAAASNNTATIATAADAKAALLELRNALTAAKVPAADRYAVVNTAFAGLLLEGLSDAAAAGSDAELRNGVVGKVYGLTVIESALFEEAVKPVAVAYHSGTVAFVSQVDKVESLRNPTKFSDIVRGLSVFGTKVVNAAGVVYTQSA